MASAVPSGDKRRFLPQRVGRREHRAVLAPCWPTGPRGTPELHERLSFLSFPGGPGAPQTQTPDPRFPLGSS